MEIKFCYPYGNNLKLNNESNLLVPENIGPGNAGSIGAGPTAAIDPGDVASTPFPTEATIWGGGTGKVAVADVTCDGSGSGSLSATLIENSTGTPILTTLDNCEICLGVLNILDNGFIKFKRPRYITSD